MTVRSRVHQVLEGHHEPIGSIVRWLLAALIVANVFAVVMETVPSFRARHATALANFEAASLAVFSIEYGLRMWSAGEHARFQGLLGRLRWMFTLGAIIDLLAIVPAVFVTDMRLVRLLRLARLIRIAKLGRYSLALRTLRHVMFARLPDLVSLSFVLLILLVLSSSLMFHLEHDAQPEQFSSIPATMWWGIVTLTTIGYGDMAPITVEGRLLGAVVAVLGIGMFALPAGLLGGAFVEELGKARRQAREQRAAAVAETPTQCPHCNRPLSADATP
ncbi:MAG: ion transporter [Planctomycetota bacterium]